MVANLKQKTGKTLDQWLKVLEAAKLEKHGQMLTLLKTDHGVTHGFANLIVHYHRNGAQPRTASGAAELVNAQYAGKKQALKPLYDALVAKLSKFGTDVELSPKKAYVSLRRSKQWALLQPSTATRLDVGLNLKGVEPTDRLEASGSFNSMCTHRVRVTSLQDIDRQLMGWLEQAYERA